MPAQTIWRVTFRAPSTTLLHRMVPLPHYRGADDGLRSRFKPYGTPHAAFRRPQRHDQGRAPRRAQPQARSRRGRAFAGVAQGAAQFRHRRRPPRRGDRYAELAKARPAYGFLGEEGGVRAGTDTSHRWIVDPLDGTTNFLHGIPHFAVSIALERDGAIVAGLTYNPANEELFIAERGKGAFLNDQRIRVAARQRLADAIVACGLPHYGRGDLALARHEIAAAQQNFAGLRRYGAATLDLAWIAAGRLDAYWERDLSPWDLAAGMILVREAGGFVSDCDGRDAILTKGQVAAGNDTMHRELLRLLKAARRAAKEAAKEPTRRLLRRLKCHQPAAKLRAIRISKSRR